MKKNIFIVILILAFAAGLIGYVLFINKTHQSEPSLVGLSTPLQASPDFKYKIKGAEKAKLIFEYNYSNSYYDYTYEGEFSNELTGKLSIAGPEPGREDIEVVITAASEDGRRSAPLKFRKSQKLKRLKYFLIGHTFVIRN